MVNYPKIARSDDYDGDDESQDNSINEFDEFVRSKNHSCGLSVSDLPSLSELNNSSISTFQLDFDDKNVENVESGKQKRKNNEIDTSIFQLNSSFALLFSDDEEGKKVKENKKHNIKKAEEENQFDVSCESFKSESLAFDEIPSFTELNSSFLFSGYDFQKKNDDSIDISIDFTSNNKSNNSEFDFQNGEPLAALSSPSKSNKPTVSVVHTKRLSHLDRSKFNTNAAENECIANVPTQFEASLDGITSYINNYHPTVQNKNSRKLQEKRQNNGKLSVGVRELADSDISENVNYTVETPVVSRAKSYCKNINNSSSSRPSRIQRRLSSNDKTSNSGFMDHNETNTRTRSNQQQQQQDEPTASTSKQQQSKSMLLSPSGRRMKDRQQRSSLQQRRLIISEDGHDNSAPSLIKKQREQHGENVSSITKWRSSDNSILAGDKIRENNARTNCSKSYRKQQLLLHVSNNPIKEGDENNTKGNNLLIRAKSTDKRRSISGASGTRPRRSLSMGVTK